MTSARRRATADTLVRVTGLVEQWPADLLDGPMPASWLVARSLPRQEKKLVADVRAMGLAGCIFFERRLRHYPGKGTQENTVPLLASYVFIAAPTDRRYSVYATKRAHLVMAVGQAAALYHELRSLRALLECSTAPLVVRPEIVDGSHVEITSGAMRGCRGVVVERSGRAELVVNLEVLGSSVATQLSAFTVEKLD